MKLKVLNLLLIISGFLFSINGYSQYPGSDYPAPGEVGVCFWTDEAHNLPISIYIDGNLIGEITASSQYKPTWASDEGLSVITPEGKHKVVVINRYGDYYSSLPQTIYPKAGEINYIKINGRSGWRRSSPYYDGGIFIYDDRYYDDDDEELIGMIVAGTAVLATSAIATLNNYSIRDQRFPYFSVSASNQLMIVHGALRSTIQARQRLGNYGGVSLLADAGMFYGLDGQGNHFTWSVGMGFDNGPVCALFRYKPALSIYDDTFLSYEVSYDWWFSQHWGLNFDAGFGAYGYGHLFSNRLDFDIPLGIGLSYKF